MNQSIVGYSRHLRKNQTNTEKKLWSLLRNRQLCNVKFRRQHPIGRYIVDFYAPEHHLAIEADGGQHYSNHGIERDRGRTQELLKAGIKILRFSDCDILNNTEGVYKVIADALSTPHLNPLPLKGERKYINSKG